jgi:hypothetical protein
LRLCGGGAKIKNKNNLKRQKERKQERKKAKRNKVMK